MAPKNGPPAAKQALVLDWFHKSLTAHSLKELEKALPSLGVPGMQVKDYIQALLDESQIRVEKIGSGNWYWAFVSDAKKDKERVLGLLKDEEGKLREGIECAEREIREEEEKRGDDEEMLIDGDGGEGVKGMGRKELLRVKEVMRAEKEKMVFELAGYKENDPTEVMRKKKETETLKDAAERWTDNIESLMSYLRKSGVDRAQIAHIMENIGGDEWVPGEGLKDL